MKTWYCEQADDTTWNCLQVTTLRAPWYWDDKWLFVSRECNWWSLRQIALQGLVISLTNLLLLLVVDFPQQTWRRHVCNTFPVWTEKLMKRCCNIVDGMWRRCAGREGNLGGLRQVVWTWKCNFYYMKKEKEKEKRKKKRKKKRKEKKVAFHF